MAEPEAEEAYEALVSWLLEHKLEWIAEQIQNEVALGKVKSERITVEKEIGRVAESLPIFRREERGGAKQTTRSSAEFLARVEYSPFEKFEIAAGAIEATVLGAVQIEDALIKLVGPVGSVNFVPGETGESRHSIEVAAVTARREALIHLTHDLKLLREDVYDANQTRSFESDQ